MYRILCILACVLVASLGGMHWFGGPDFSLNVEKPRAEVLADLASLDPAQAPHILPDARITLRVTEPPTQQLFFTLTDADGLNSSICFSLIEDREARQTLVSVFVSAPDIQDKAEGSGETRKAKRLKANLEKWLRTYAAAAKDKSSTAASLDGIRLVMDAVSSSRGASDNETP